MVSFRDHHTHLILATLQSCAILGGALLTAAFCKAHEDFLDGNYRLHHSDLLSFLLNYTRFWGFTFLTIPAIWVCGAIWLERHHPEHATRERIVTSGVVLFVGLLAMFFWLVFSAAAPPAMGPIGPIGP